MPLAEVSPPAEESPTPVSPGPLLRRVADLKTRNVQPETVRRLAHARVVFADYERLRQDFPQLRDESLERSHAELQSLAGSERRLAVRRIIDAWLLRNVAFISEKQARQEAVNTRIEVTAETATAFRPPHYGRALVYSLAESRPHAADDPEAGEGLLDVKGTGVGPKAEPHFGPHGDGLMKLYDAFREVAFQKLMDFVFRAEGVPYTTVPLYAAIDAGFDCKHTVRPLPAGLLVRRAHRRPVYRWGTKEPDSPAVPLELKIEFLLRRYGITSVSPATTIDIAERGGGTHIKYGFFNVTYSPEKVERIKGLTGFKGEPQQFDGVCMQFTRDVEADPPRAEIIDLGGYFVRERFENPLVSLVACRIMRLGEIIGQTDARFTQPEERFVKAYRFDARGGPKFKSPLLAGVDPSRPEPQMTDVRVLARDLAFEYRAGRLDGQGVLDTLDAYVEDVTSRWH
ncbi:MAG: hypothetical protein JOZ96_04720 [Acidobacteria bacterium]|nr:hypothetical protein [Acidobacteriota bacterium]